MEISYKKNLDKSYMLIKAEKKPQMDYRMKMVINNAIDGFCDFSIREFNNEDIFYYDISEKSSMQNIFSRQKMKSADIKKFVYSLQKMFESAREYMLDINRVLLDFDYIFLENNNERYLFCYYPGKEESFEVSLMNILNDIIKVTDHTDRESVIVSYGLQQLGSKEGTTVAELLKFINTTETKSCSQRSDDLDSVGYVTYKNEMKEDVKYGDGIEENIYKSSTNKEEILKGKLHTGDEDKIRKKGVKEKRNSFITWIKKKIKFRENYDGYLAESEYMSKEYENREEKEPEQESCNTREYFSDKYSNANDIQYVSGDEVSYIGEDGSGYCGEGTVLLRPQPVVIGIILKSVDLEICQTIIPNDFPCVIGKSKKSADCIVEDKTVSRVHLRISEEEDGYYAEDLNSTNGSFINGEKLKPHTPTKINVGDKIKLAQIEYMVC